MLPEKGMAKGFENEACMSLSMVPGNGWDYPIHTYM